MKPLRIPFSKRLGSALVMTLVIIVLITVVTVGYLASVMLETKTASSTLDQERAYGIAMVGAHQALAKIRHALGPWDDPYKEFAINPPPFYWSLSPGRITRWDYRSTNSTNFGLFSESAGSSLVNLNRPLIDGSYPIIGGTNPPQVSVRWASLLRDPTQPASASNAVVGRYAFWVDDEGAKINVNTADGTEKYTTNSLGIGTPSEVSLEWVLGGTNAKALTKEVVQMARTNGFTSPDEVLRVAGMSTNAVTNQMFALTAYSRSPELNVFGQPRVAVSPLLGDGGWPRSNMVLNSLTLLPAREIYPTPSQLPPYVISSPYDPENQPRNHPWPLALRGEIGAVTTGNQEAPDFRTVMPQAPRVAPNYSHNQGFLLAKYLAGTNAADQPVTWPVFQGSSTQGFAGKYTPRQLDSIVAQILSIGCKAISSDYPCISPPFGEQLGHRFMVAPYVFPGWLSRQWVIGVGRSIKLTQMYMRVGAYPSDPPGATWNPSDPSAYTPPFATMDFWLEWWLPAGYFGGEEVRPLEASRFFVGHRGAPSALNVMDVPRSLRDPVPVQFAGPLPRDPTVPTYCYWADQLLWNNQGIDFAGNPSVDGTGTPVKDHDQPRALAFHDPFARIDPAVQAIDNYKGTAGSPTVLNSGDYGDYASPFFLTELEPNNSPPKEWQPGEMRSIRSQLGPSNPSDPPSYRMYMQTNANNSILQIGGGLAVKTQLRTGLFSDPDPVPLEAVRGAYVKNGICTQEPFDIDENESAINNFWSSVQAVPGDPTKGNLRDRVLASVIPLDVTLQVSGEFMHVMMKLKGPRTDPLVNKFPGDWETTVGAASSTTIQPSNDPKQPNVYQDTAFRGTLADPDSYWMPQADAGLCDSIADVAIQTQIPRSARMPNIGYLQYLRTGIIPDDETVNYSQQHGTPFRLLSFAPSYEPRNPANPLVGQQTTNSASQSYPDWALLDLFYIPSTLAPYGSTYNPAVATPATNAVETRLLYYGTYGGATAGKMNPNGAVIYTTNVDVPETNISRRLPLESIFNGVMVNQSVTGSGTNVSFTGGINVPATNIAAAIESYLRTNGPFRMPAEICNVPRIADLSANPPMRATNNPTRNDLVRQVVGALTTQGNVFSVWTVGQAVKKKPAHTDYGEFEPGDNVLAEVRLHLVVERYLDPGADGVYGGSAGPDNVPGTYDDPTDNNHPFEPRYLYRVIASEEIR